ncbi:hypothetical protein FACS189494_05730 [Spirochaetia bacterium]|nr:hypothetical protein FACS189494_05730 [Spirochaetia bacterium]
MCGRWYNTAMRICVFIFDLIRFSLVTALFIASQNTEVETLFFFPIAMLFTSLALFPIMMFFLIIDPEKYKVFASLYCAGKIISVCAVVSAFIHALYVMIPTIIFWTANKFILNLAVPFLTILDILCIVVLFPKTGGK